MSAIPARNFTRLAVAVVIAAVVILAATLSYSAIEATVTKTSTFTTTISVFGGARLVGTCATNNYLVPDTVQSSSVVTVTSDGSTSSYTTYYPLSTTDYGGTSYTTTINANSTGAFTIYSTTTWYSSPSEGGTVTVCTFSG
jgi:hypothetical protein